MCNCYNKGSKMEDKEKTSCYYCKDCANYNRHYIFMKNKFHYIGRGTCIRKRETLLCENSKICPRFSKLDKVFEKKLYEDDLRKCLNKIYDLMLDVSYYFDLYDQ